MGFLNVVGLLRGWDFWGLGLLSVEGLLSVVGLLGCGTLSVVGLLRDGTCGCGCGIPGCSGNSEELEL